MKALWLQRSTSLLFYASLWKIQWPSSSFLASWPHWTACGYSSNSHSLLIQLNFSSKNCFALQLKVPLATQRFSTFLLVNLKFEISTLLRMILIETKIPSRKYKDYWFQNNPSAEEVSAPCPCRAVTHKMKHLHSHSLLPSNGMEILFHTRDAMSAAHLRYSSTRWLCQQLLSLWICLPILYHPLLYNPENDLYSHFWMSEFTKYVASKI